MVLSEFGNDDFLSVKVFDEIESIRWFSDVCRPSNLKGKEIIFIEFLGCCTLRVHHCVCTYISFLIFIKLTFLFFEKRGRLWNKLSNSWGKARSCTDSKYRAEICTQPPTLSCYQNKQSICSWALSLSKCYTVFQRTSTIHASALWLRDIGTFSERPCEVSTDSLLPFPLQVEK